jgi:hypothetical protein
MVSYAQGDVPPCSLLFIFLCYNITVLGAKPFIICHQNHKFLWTRDYG